MLVSGCLESMCHKFNSQGLGLRILELMIASPKSGGFSSRVLGLRVPLRSQVPGSRVLGPRVSGSRVSGPDFRLCQVNVLLFFTFAQEEFKQPIKQLQSEFWSRN